MPLSSLKATEATLSLRRPCPVRWRMARRDQEPPPPQRLGSESSAVAAEEPDGWGQGTLGGALSSVSSNLKKSSMKTSLSKKQVMPSIFLKQ